MWFTAKAHLVKCSLWQKGLSLWSICKCVYVFITLSGPSELKYCRSIFTERGVWNVRFKFCRAGDENLVRDGSPEQLDYWKDRASLQTVFALRVSPATDQQTSMSLRRRNKRDTEASTIAGLHWMKKLNNCCLYTRLKYYSMCTRAHVLLQKATCTCRGTQMEGWGFTGNRSSSPAFEERPSQS